MLFFKHTETDHAHVYTTKGSTAAYIIIAVLISAWVFSFYQKLAGGLIIFGIAFLVAADAAPMVFRQFWASFSGKNVKSSGGFGRGSIEISK